MSERKDISPLNRKVENMKKVTNTMKPEFTNAMNTIVEILRVNEFTAEELLILNKVIVSKLKAERTVGAAIVKAQLEVGMTVEWSGKKGFQRGTIVKINRTKAVIDTNTGMMGNWIVPMTMLKIVK